MKEIEQQIIDELEKLKEVQMLDLEKSVSHINSLLKKLSQKPFGTSSTEFINHPSLNIFIEKNCPYDIPLWFQIEDYLVIKNDIVLAQEKLSYIEIELKKYLSTSEQKARGVGMLPSFVTAEFMRNLYSSNDKNLIALFSKYLPIPRASVFPEHGVPEIIAKQEQDSTQAIIKLLQGQEENNVEKKVVNVQRRMRSQLRKKEEIQRVSFQYKITNEEAKQLLGNANTPYTPKCDLQLAKRIMQAAKNVELFSTLKHLTSASGLTSIFDGGLYGRRTLLQFYLPFKPAALAAFDIRQGDGNVICLGPNKIHYISPDIKNPNIQLPSMGFAPEIELQFDAKKMAGRNPAVFFKQRDLGFIRKKIRKVTIGNNGVDLFFSHTSASDPKECEFRLFPQSSSEPFAFAEVQNALLIAYDVKKMHQILTLNFFRFIDALENIKGNEDIGTKEKIYAELAKLDNQELIETLQQIGQKMTDTMEFNIYGAYQIDFSALINIKRNKPSYILDLPTFINDLNLGDVGKLNEAREKIPEIFNSHRFIDYLLSHVKNEVVSEELSQQRENCVLPPWKTSKKL